jgi:hypothetical protein
VVVVPDRDGECEESLENAHEDALLAVAAVSFQAELAFQCVEDGLDDLADRFQLSAPDRFGSRLSAGRTSSIPCAARRVSNSRLA